MGRDRIARDPAAGLAPAASTVVLGSPLTGMAGRMLAMV
jgi:uracil-DNA glycosylase